VDAVRALNPTTAASEVDRLGRDLAMDAYRRMVLIRTFEERIFDLFGQGWIRGTSHMCVGQEAVAVGACAGLRPEDQVTSNHRGHGHFLAKGGDPKRIMAELFGKATGYAAGRGGSQHMACYEIGFLGSNGITGGGIPIATGAALANLMQGLDRVVLCFFGDGASAQGTFHESLNMAGLWRLPVIYLCENNGYAMSTPASQVSAIANIGDRGPAYAMPGVVVDGFSVAAVRDSVREAAERARAGAGPTLIEAKTYRFMGHSKGDPCHYRTREEEAAHRALCPIARLRQGLIVAGIADQDWLDDAAAWASAEVDAAVQFAQESPDPVGGLDEGVFAE